MSKTAVHTRTSEPRTATRNRVAGVAEVRIVRGEGLLLPGALLVAIETQLLASFMFVNFCLAALFQ